MTLVAPKKAFLGAPGALARRVVLAGGPALAGALWFACHPYGGVAGDARIYLGRALANRDPAGLGRDLAFALDGQSGYSLFPALLTPLVGALGAPRAGLVVACCAVAASFAAAFAFARALVGTLAGAPAGVPARRQVLAIVVALAVLPAAYGAGVFNLAEASAVPRPFAEALVLAALAATLAGRWAMASGMLCVALLIHPIMAMAGIGTVALLALCHSVPSRLRAHASLILAVALLAGAFAAPFVFARVDDEWFGILTERSPHLFPTLWKSDSFVPLVAQLATIAVSASLTRVAARRVLVAAALSGVGQLCAAALFADTLHFLLPLQAQLWRATWLVAVAGDCALAIAVAGLWGRGASGRLTLSLLVPLWFAGMGLPAALCAGSLALAAHFGALGEERCQRLLRPVALGAAALVLVEETGLLVGLADALRGCPSGVILPMIVLVGANLETLPVCLIAAVWLLRPAAGGKLAASAAAVAIAVIAAFSFDGRTDFDRFIETVGVPDGFEQMMAGRPPEVLWLGGLSESWFMLGRPQYLSPQQAVGFVFSRPLAVEWRRRADELVALGLAHADIRAPWRLMAADDRLRATPAALAALCRQPDAPGVVVVPARDDLLPPEMPGALAFAPHAPGWIRERRPVPEWHRILGWIAMPCAPRRS